MLNLTYRMVINYYHDTRRRKFSSIVREVLLPYLVSFYYQTKAAVPRVYNLIVKSTGMRLKLRLKVTGDSRFPVIDTILLRRLGLYEPDTSVILRDELRDGDHVLELGAAEGYFTIQMSRYVGKKGAIYSFEPNKHFYDDLLFNLALNNCKNVIARNEALGSIEELIDGHGHKFKTNSLKEFLSSLKNPLDFIFVDVDAKTSNHAEVRQETAIIDIIVDYAGKQRRNPKIFLEYILEDNASFDMKNRLLGAGYTMRRITKRHFLFT